MTLPDEATTAGQVKTWAKIADSADDPALAEVCGAVNALVRELPIVQTLAADVDLQPYPANVTLGATMLAARLWRRRNSAEGVATFGADGPVYVQRNDPDIALLLRLNRPAVG